MHTCTDSAYDARFGRYAWASMITIAYVFPGQGSQSVGMGQALAASSPAARLVFEHADEALGEPISRLAWQGPEEDLNRTENAQPALLAG